MRKLAADRAVPGGLRIAALAVVAVLAMGIAACGEDEPDVNIPRSNGEQLLGQLDSVREAVKAGSCDEAQSAAQGFIDAVNELPDTVGMEPKQALRDAGSRLDDLVSEQCEAPSQPEQPEQPEQPSTGATGASGEVPSDEPTEETADTEEAPAPPAEGPVKAPPEQPEGEGDPGSSGPGGHGETRGEGGSSGPGGGGGEGDGTGGIGADVE